MYGSLASPNSKSYSEKPHLPLSQGHGQGPSVEHPRRAFSLPIMKIKMPFSGSSQSSASSSSSSSAKYGLGLGISGGSPLLPTLHGSPGRSTARRFSYSVKNRAAHYSFPLTVGGLFTLAVFVLVRLRGSSSSEVGSFNSHASGKLQIYGRSRFSDEEHQHRVHLPDGERDNGVSLLVMDEEELIAEDDLFWDSYTDPEPMTEEERLAEEEMKAHKQDVIEHDKKQSLRALVWWLAEGGIIPSTWEAPTKAYLRKVGGRGMERLLEDIDRGEEDEEIFENGWAEFANKRYKIVVFSKTHCPYSKKAKKILGEYRLSPAPFIIELDQRSDMEQLQTLLQRLTGRRTVPNVILDFTSIGGSDDITLFHAEGGLQRRFEDMGVVPGSRRRRPVLPPPPPKPVVEETKPEAPVVEQQQEDSEAPVAGVHDDFKRAIPVVAAPQAEEQLPIPVLAETPLINTVTEPDSESEQAPPAKRQKRNDSIEQIRREIEMKRAQANTNADRLHARSREESRKAAPGIGSLDTPTAAQVKRGSRGKVLF
ncbi:glutaredoxin [Kwoniella newhampshirensis]|uniref:Glutaredoxin n=1 Tax=Kwoniella newhampshirensis TaxID=1651941 RepID=A0AAW0Z671_9TREE